MFKSSVTRRGIGPGEARGMASAESDRRHSLGPMDRLPPHCLGGDPGVGQVERLVADLGTGNLVPGRRARGADDLKLLVRGAFSVGGDDRTRTDDPCLQSVVEASEQTVAR